MVVLCVDWLVSVHPFFIPSQPHTQKYNTLIPLSAHHGRDDGGGGQCGADVERGEALSLGRLAEEAAVCVFVRLFIMIYIMIICVFRSLFVCFGSVRDYLNKGKHKRNNTGRAWLILARLT